MFATGSTDKCLKIWKRKSNGGSDDCDESNSPEMMDENEMMFDNAQIDDRNNDFLNDEEGQEIDQHLLSQMNKYEEFK